jgi:uncharacterized membrane protein
MIGMNSYTEAAGDFIREVSKYGVEITYIPGHYAATDFPMTEEEMRRYQVIIISDIGSNSLLLHPKVQTRCERIPNRLRELCKYVEQGGGLLMCGGYMGFTGFMGKARYKVTPLADILPVELMDQDDRVEEPSGVFPEIKEQNHPILEGIDGRWPDFLGYNRLRIRPEGTEIASVNGRDAFIAVREYGKGRTGVFASDMAPHWAPPEFLYWKYYGMFFANYIKWLAHEK